ncbi:hypothetical protein NMY22_g17657 [Coprinellus aureogranulatus]|nr:hypothetical protein NMY22_g17657 [Coprinellus aureogranulatus]
MQVAASQDVPPSSALADADVAAFQAPTRAFDRASVALVACLSTTMLDAFRLGKRQMRVSDPGELFAAISIR